MTVHFVGAGPGAADLLTVRATRILAACQVCLYAGSLVPAEVLSHCPDDARLVDTANLTLDQIVAQMTDAHARGEDVARLCSGDPSVWSALTEQVRRLREAGVPYDVTPGVPSFAAAAATLGVELTVPTVGQSVVLTRTQARSSPMPDGERLESFAATGATLALHLAVQRIDELATQLLTHYGPACPVAVVARVSQPDELVLRGTLADIAATVREAGVTRTAVVLVGPVLAAADFPDSYLYSPSRPRSSDPS
ncbi:precorrin-4 C(11)-methyltransferase [Angustibacter sp. McL0619]|uniref:precorrin-4 C(11)-methyltransferase n=1 Tax=Angustibacter sp. McL0619 TaxID=3415676 RepID=UPI003CF96278